MCTVRSAWGRKQAVGTGSSTIFFFLGGGGGGGGHPAHAEALPCQPLSCQGSTRRSAHATSWSRTLKS